MREKNKIFLNLETDLAWIGGLSMQVDITFHG
jgi:hypothetical protein